jgi:hypothetical protein
VTSTSVAPVAEPGRGATGLLLRQSGKPSLLAALKPSDPERETLREDASNAHTRCRESIFVNAQLSPGPNPVPRANHLYPKLLAQLVA